MEGTSYSLGQLIQPELELWFPSQPEQPFDLQAYMETKRTEVKAYAIQLGYTQQQARAVADVYVREVSNWLNSKLTQGPQALEEGLEKVEYEFRARVELMAYNRFGLPPNEPIFDLHAYLETKRAEAKGYAYYLGYITSRARAIADLYVSDIGGQLVEAIKQGQRQKTIGQIENEFQARVQKIAIDAFGAPTRDEVYPFYGKLNPTGDPIGGGVGYRDIKTPGQADYVVSTKKELFRALLDATAGQIIYVEDGAEIDLSGHIRIPIRGGVTLASGRGRDGSSGALIYSNTTYPNDNEKSNTIITAGPNVRITGLRLCGPTGFWRGHMPDHHGIANAIRSYYPGLEVDNCELWAWDKWAIWLYISDQAHIHHNYFHHTHRRGFGYGVWQGGAGDAVGEYALFEANNFNDHRHDIASSGHPNTWEARYNIILEGSGGGPGVFDRHGGTVDEGPLKGKQIAGWDTIIRRNLILVPSAFSAGGAPAGKFIYVGNWTVSPNIREAVSLRPEYISYDSPKFVHHDNHFNFEMPVHPVPVVTVSTQEGYAPLTVRFDASESYDSGGGTLTEYHWSFGDGKRRVGNTARGKQVSYMFDEPGVYYVRLRVFNEYGVSYYKDIPVKIKPRAGGYVLSAWVADSYGDPLAGQARRTGYFKKQVLIDGQVIWEKDVAADNDRWDHVVKNITHLVEGKDMVEVSFRLLAVGNTRGTREDFYELFMHVDDVHLFGGRIRDGAMEGANLFWRWQESTSRNFAMDRRQKVARSGTYGLQIEHPHGRPAVKDSWGRFYQQVPIGEPLAAARGD